MTVDNDPGGGTASAQLRPAAGDGDSQRDFVQHRNASGGSGVIKSVLTASTTGPQATLRLADDVLLLIVHDGSGRLIDLSGQVAAVTESGAAMLEVALRQGHDSACKTLAARYGVAEDVIRRDLESLFASLGNQRMLVPASKAISTGSIRRSLAWMLYPMVMLCARRPQHWPEAKASALMVWGFLATRLFGWANAIRVWDRAGRMLQQTAAGSDSTALAAIDAAVLRAIARHPLTVNCKERALTAWILTRAAGIPACVQLGVDLFPFALHCWCEHGSAIVADRYEGRCDRYTPIMTYG